MPPRRSLPSLCLLRRLKVSRLSLNRPVFVFKDAKLRVRISSTQPRWDSMGSPAETVLPGRVEVSRAEMTLERGDINPSLSITCLHATRKIVENPATTDGRKEFRKEKKKSPLTQTGYASPSWNQILSRHLLAPFPTCPNQFHPLLGPKRRLVSPQAS